MKVTVGVVAIAALASCNQLVGFDVGDLHEADASSSPDARSDASIPDAAPDAFAAACDPINQIGCAANEKCTWIIVDPESDPGGVIGCVPDGSIAHGAACTRGPNGATTGYDNCVAGAYCVGGNTTVPGICEAICRLDADTCAGATRCSRYATLFGTAIVGLCDFTCDPVTQTRLSDNAAACGSANPAAPDWGCYKGDARAGVCARAVPDRKQDAIAYDWPDQLYLNGCAPGYAPLITESSAQESAVLCAAYCRPTATSSANPGGEGGLPGSGYTCADRGATTHECKYFWYLREGGAPNPADNGVGVCWTPADFLWDFDNNPSTPDTAHPACNTLSASDTDGDGVPQYTQYGCAPAP